MKKKAAPKKALTPAQKKRAATLRAQKAEAARIEKFCIEYVFNGNNGTQAYLKINPKVTTETAATAAWRLLRNADVLKRIDALQEEHHNSLITNHQRVLREVSGLALFDPMNMFDENGGLLQLHEMDPVTRKMVNEIEIVLGDEDNRGIRMAKIKYGKDKRAYIDMMMKHYNQYEAHQVAGSIQPVTVYLHEADANL